MKSFDILEPQGSYKSIDCQTFTPTIPNAATFRISDAPDGTVEGTFSCVEGYHMLGDPNAICDLTTTGNNKWVVGTNQNIPRCAANVAKNKPAYQSGSPDRDDLLSEASKGTKSTVTDTITQTHIYI